MFLFQLQEVVLQCCIKLFCIHLRVVCDCFEVTKNFHIKNKNILLSCSNWIIADNNRLQILKYLTVTRICCFTVKIYSTSFNFKRCLIFYCSNVNLLTCLNKKKLKILNLSDFETFNLEETMNCFKRLLKLHSCD